MESEESLHTELAEGSRSDVKTREDYVSVTKQKFTKTFSAEYKSIMGGRDSEIIEIHESSSGNEHELAYLPEITISKTKNKV